MIFALLGKAFERFQEFELELIEKSIDNDYLRSSSVPARERKTFATPKPPTGDIKVFATYLS